MNKHLITAALALCATSALATTPLSQPTPPPPPPTQRAAATASRNSVVPSQRVSVAPPPMRAETRTPAPSANHQWIDGHWAWNNGAHVWTPGSWAMPPSPGHVWEPVRWVREGNEWVYTPGYWREEYTPAPAVAYEPPPAVEVIAEGAIAPPAPMIEVQPVLPFAGAVWLPGYWHWHPGYHRYLWVGGRYSAPRIGYAWQPHRWEAYGHGYRMVPGGWRHR